MIRYSSKMIHIKDGRLFCNWCQKRRWYLLLFVYVLFIVSSTTGQENNLTTTVLSKASTEMDSTTTREGMATIGSSKTGIASTAVQETNSRKASITAASTIIDSTTENEALTTIGISSNALQGTNAAKASFAAASTIIDSTTENEAFTIIALRSSTEQENNLAKTTLSTVSAEMNSKAKRETLETFGSSTTGITSTAVQETNSAIASIVATSTKIDSTTKNEALKTSGSSTTGISSVTAEGTNFTDANNTTTASTRLDSTTENEALPTIGSPTTVPTITSTTPASNRIGSTTENEALTAVGSSTKALRPSTEQENNLVKTTLSTASAEMNSNAKRETLATYGSSTTGITPTAMQENNSAKASIAATSTKIDSTTKNEALKTSGSSTTDATPFVSTPLATNPFLISTTKSIVTTSVYKITPKDVTPTDRTSIETTVHQNTVIDRATEKDRISPYTTATTTPIDLTTLLTTTLADTTSVNSMSKDISFYTTSLDTTSTMETTNIDITVETSPVVETTTVDTTLAETTPMGSTTSLATSEDTTSDISTPTNETTTVDTTLAESTSIDETTDVGTSMMATTLDTASKNTNSLMRSTPEVTTPSRTTMLETTPKEDPTTADSISSRRTTLPDRTTMNTTLPTTGITSTGYQRRYVIPLLASESANSKYKFTFMDTDLSNTTTVRLNLPSLGKTFFGGVENAFQLGLPSLLDGVSERSTIEVESTGDISLYFSLSSSGYQFFCYPIAWLGTDYIVSTSYSRHNTSILITALSFDTKVQIFFSSEFVWEGKIYNFENDLIRTFSELESFSLRTPFDPSGTYVKASKPVAVVIQLQPAENPSGDGTSSSTYFLPPVSSWGTEYWFSSSPKDRLSFRVTAAYNGSSVTVVTIPTNCSGNGGKIQLNAWQTHDFINYVNCSIGVSSDLPVLVVKTEYPNNDSGYVMVVPPIASAAKGFVGIPLFVSAENIGNNLRILVSDGEYESLRVNGGEHNSWNLIGKDNSTGVFVETELQSGYHEVSTTSDNSELLITVDKNHYAAHQSFTGYQVCPFDRIYFHGIEMTFEATFPGNSAQSLEVCGGRSSNPYMSLARRSCGEKSWKDPVPVKCYSRDEISGEIEELSEVSVTLENVEEFVDEVAIVASQTNDLSSGDLNNVGKLLKRIVATGTPSKKVANSVVGIVNNVMESNKDELDKAENLSSYVEILEKQITNVHQSPENFTEVVSSVGVKAVKINPNITKAITFVNIAPSNQSKEERLNADLSDENFKLYNDEKEVQNGKSLTSIYIHPYVFNLVTKEYQGKKNIPLSFFIYKNDTLLQSTKSPDVCNGITGEKIVSQVIAGKVEIENFTIENLPTEAAIITRFITTKGTDGNETGTATCVFWNDRKQFWSEEGCSMVSNLDDENQTVCRCNHLTSFAVLFRIKKECVYPPKVYLDVMTKVGSSLSVVGLSACILTLISVKNLRVKQTSKIHINLCLCLIGFYITFLAGDWAKGKKTHCRNIASATHYFCLALVAWMCAEAINMYFMFIKYARSNLKHFIPTSCILCYGIPLIPTLLTHFLDDTDLKDYCVLHPGPALYYGLLLEILVMVIFNFVVFVLIVRRVVFRKMLSTTAKEHKGKEIVSRIQQFVLFWIILGLSWTLGFLSAIPKFGEVFTVLFCVTISLQGFILFIFICVKNPEVKTFLAKTKSNFTKSVGSQGNGKNSSSSSRPEIKVIRLPRLGRQNINVNEMSSGDVNSSENSLKEFTNPAYIPNRF